MADIVLGAKQIKNPHGYKPALDTDEPKRKPVTRKGYMSVEPYHPGDSGMDTHNPAPNDIQPEEKKHPIDELFGRGIKRSNGPNFPKKDIEISDN